MRWQALTTLRLNNEISKRSEIKRIAEGIPGNEAVHLPSLYQDVVMKRVSLESVATQLGSTESKQLAYEMAVCVCDADGAHSQAEQAFPDALRAAWKLEARAAEEFTLVADELAGIPLDSCSTAAIGTAAKAIAVNDAEPD